MTHPAARRRHWIAGFKIALAVGILAFLFYRLRGEDVFARLLREPKDWTHLAVAQCLVIAALTLNYVRWYVLVRALELDFHLTDALRLGSLGMMLNQVSPGSVGGDLFKAAAIAHEQPRKRTEAVASVVIDRAVGLYAMLLVASAGALVGATQTTFTPGLQALASVVIGLAIAGTVGIALLMTPAFASRWMRGMAGRLPVVGGTLLRLLAAADAYRRRRAFLFAGIGIACATHTLFVVALWLIGRGLPVAAPGLVTTFVVGPLSLAAGAIPLTPSGLGTFEAVMDELYRSVGGQRGDGLLVAITHRVMMYVMAAIGAVYYLRARKSVTDVIREAEAVENREHRATHPR